jgi:hypothetical protein
MLRLLAQNDDSYEDIAALKGTSVEQVKAEVREALAAAAAEQDAGPPEPTQAAPAEEPPPPAAKPKAPSKPKPERKPRAPIPPQRRRLLVLAAGAIAVVGLVLIAIAVLGGGPESSSPTAEETQTVASEGTPAASKNLTQAELKPVDGSDAKGQAVFGRLQKKIVLLVEAVGLEPNAQGESYTIWLYKSPKLAVRVASVKVTKSGGIRVPVQLTPEIFGAVLARVFDRINVSRTDDAAYEREVAQAKQQKKLPAYSGETVLSGEVTGPVLKKNAKQGG